jgi:hypothetical protein
MPRQSSKEWSAIDIFKTCCEILLEMYQANKYGNIRQCYCRALTLAVGSFERRCNWLWVVIGWSRGIPFSAEVEIRVFSLRQHRSPVPFGPMNGGYWSSAGKRVGSDRFFHTLSRTTISGAIPPFDPHRCYPHLIVVVGFECSWDPESYAGDSVATGRATQAGQVKG